MTASAWWAWSDDLMHAWPLTEEQVQQAKRNDTMHSTVCGKVKAVRERPARPPHAEAELNHCPDCWAILNPRPISGMFLDALIRPDLPRADTRWRRTG